MTKNLPVDVLVVGSGPAGLAAAAHLGEAGLRVVGVSPDPDAPWPNTYGVWVDEVAPLGYAPFLAHVWNDTVGNFGQGEVALGTKRMDGLITPALREHLLRLEAKKLRVSSGTGGSLRRSPTKRKARASLLQTGQTYSARAHR